MVQFRRDWLGSIDMMHQEMSRLLDHFAGSKVPMFRFSPAVWEPAIDIYETDDELVVTIELAGVRESDIEIIVNHHAFAIRGERKKSLLGSRKGTYHQMEIASGSFERRITLPVAIDATNVQAHYEDGLVEVVLPKARDKRTFKVSIKTS